MDPITTALVSGVGLIVKGLASEAVKDAYKGLKDLLMGKISSLANLEEDPADEAYRKASERELQKKGLADDRAVLTKAEELARAIGREQPDTVTRAGIVIADLQAAHDIVVKRLQALGDVRIVGVVSKTGKIEIEGVSAGATEKN